MADIGSTYGFGSSTAALAGANRSAGYDGYAMDRSPSLMSFLPSVNSYGLLGAHDEFEKIQNVHTDDFFYGGSSQTGDFDTNIPDTFNFLFGSVFALGKSDWNHRIGVDFSMPVDKVTEPSTKDNYQPQYAGYSSDSQRMTVSLGGSSMPADWLSVGFGMHYHLVQAASYESRMPSDTGAGRTTTGNLKMTVKPVIAPFAGATLVTNPESLKPESVESSHYFTIHYLAARDAKVKIRNEVLMGVVGSTPVSFDNEASLFYDPETWSLGWAYKSINIDVMASLDRELWSKYDGGIMKYSFRTFQGTFQQYKNDIIFKDIWIPRVGVSFKWSDSAFRMGAAYRESPHSDMDGKTNYIEPDRWIGGLGYSFPSKMFGLLDSPIKLESHVQAHYLVPKQVTKTDSTSLGAPGYKIGGWMFSYGINVVVGI